LVFKDILHYETLLSQCPSNVIITHLHQFLGSRNLKVTGPCESYHLYVV